MFAVLLDLFHGAFCSLYSAGYGYSFSSCFMTCCRSAIVLIVLIMPTGRSVGWILLKWDNFEIHLEGLVLCSVVSDLEGRRLEGFHLTHIEPGPLNLRWCCCWSKGWIDIHSKMYRQE